MESYETYNNFQFFLCHMGLDLKFIAYLVDPYLVDNLLIYKIWKPHANIYELQDVFEKCFKIRKTT